MRMWMIDPKLLCDKHLLGEHGEIHKHKHVFEKGYSIKGRLSPFVAIEPAAMKLRHDELAREMEHRGMNHKSPYTMPPLDKYTDEEINAKVNTQYNIQDLCARCEECRKNIMLSNRSNKHNTHNHED